MRLIKCDSVDDLVERVTSILCADSTPKPEKAADDARAVASDYRIVPGILVVERDSDSLSLPSPWDYPADDEWWQYLADHPESRIERSWLKDALAPVGITTLGGFWAETYVTSSPFEDYPDSRARELFLVGPTSDDVSWDSLIDTLAAATDSDDVTRGVTAGTLLRRSLDHGLSRIANLRVELDREHDRAQDTEQPLRRELDEREGEVESLKAQLARTKEDADTLMHAYLGLLRKQDGDDGHGSDE